MKERWIDVYLHDRLVGTLAETADHRVAFSYSEEWLGSGFAISPFSLPLEQKVFVPFSRQLDGLWGVFADSLPGAWGHLTVDRMLKSRGISPAEVTPLERLAIVGDSGRGALTYRPGWDVHHEAALTDLDELAAGCQAMADWKAVDDPDAIFQLAGSAGGSRPKIMTEEWIIKFPASPDMPEAGVMEKAYMDCAASCGILVPETRLIPSRRCSGYFAVRRFDREQQGDRLIRRHMLTAAAILEADQRSPGLDYQKLMKMTRILSRSNEADTEQMFRRMCFNVFAHNLDDHAGNFTWLYDPGLDCWHPSPAYDLTWSTSYFGEHATSVGCVAKAPGTQDLVFMGQTAGMSREVCRRIADEIREKTAELERKYRDTRS